VASRGYCWGRHLRPSPKAVGCKQRGGRIGEASCEGKEDAPEGSGAKGVKRRPAPPEEKRRGGAHSLEAARTTKGRRA